jgi:hypothetical protein
MFEWIESLFGNGSVEGADEDWSPTTSAEIIDRDLDAL